MYLLYYYSLFFNSITSIVIFLQKESNFVENEDLTVADDTSCLRDNVVRQSHEEEYLIF